MKKFLSIICAVAIIMNITACGNSKEKSKKKVEINALSAYVPNEWTESVCNDYIKGIEGTQWTWNDENGKNVIGLFYCYDGDNLSTEELKEESENFANENETVEIDGKYVISRINAETEYSEDEDIDLMNLNSLEFYENGYCVEIFFTKNAENDAKEMANSITLVPFEEITDTIDYKTLDTKYENDYMSFSINGNWEQKNSGDIHSFNWMEKGVIKHRISFSYIYNSDIYQRKTTEELVEDLLEHNKRLDEDSFRYYNKHETFVKNGLPYIVSWRDGESKRNLRFISNGVNGSFYFDEIDESIVIDIVSSIEFYQ